MLTFIMFGPIRLRRPSLLAVALLAIVVGPPAPAPAQTIDVRLEVSERTGDLFGGAFDSALAALDEVELSGTGEPADYRLDVTVLCRPESGVCEDASSYALSIVLSEPLTGGLLANGLERTGDAALSEWAPTSEAEAYLQRYRRIHALWTVVWGRDEARAGVERLVDRVETRCFERRRLLERRAALEGREVADMILNRSADEGWLC